MASRSESDLAGLRAGVCLLEARYVLVSGERPRSGSPTDNRNDRTYADTMSRNLQDNLAVSIAWFKGMSSFETTRRQRRLRYVLESNPWSKLGCIDVG